MMNFFKISALTTSVVPIGCAHNKVNQVSEPEAARIDRTLVKETADDSDIDKFEAKIERKSTASNTAFSQNNAEKS